MARAGSLSVAIFAVILAISTQQAFALKCWSCNNILKYCDDPFVSSKFSGAEKLSLIDCPNGRCVKTIANITAPVGQPSLSVNRFCARTPQQADDHCKEKGFTFCGSCASDECNGAAQYKPIAIMVAISVAAAKIFLF